MRLPMQDNDQGLPSVMFHCKDQPRSQGPSTYRSLGQKMPFQFIVKLDLKAHSEISKLSPGGVR